MCGSGDAARLAERANEHPDAAAAELTALRASGAATGGQLYLLARMLTASGAADEALVVLDEAEAAFRKSGEELDAARVDAGRSNVLSNLGHHGQAVAAADRWVRWLQAASLPADAVERRTLLAQARANVGLMLEDSGDYVAALAMHDAAIAEARDQPEMRAVLEINRANVLNLLGRSPDALVALRRAAEVLGAAGEDDDLAVVAINAGESLCRMGRPDEGLDWFARAADLVVPGSADEATLLVETADAFAALGAMGEAAARYGEALELMSRLPLAWLEARAWTGAGAAALARGQRSEASAAFAAASTAHRAAGNVPGWAAAEADTLATMAPDADERAGRLAALEEATTRLDDDSWPVQASHVHLRLAELVGDDAAAERHLRRARQLADRVGLPQLAVRAAVRLGGFLAERNRTDEAADVLATALLLADGVRARLHTDELLRTFPSTVADGYDKLVGVRLSQGRPLEALALADEGRSRTLADHAGGTDLGGKVAEWRAADDELGAVYDRLLSLDAAEGPGLRRELDERARRLEQRLQRVQLSAGRGRRRPRDAGLGEVGEAEVQVLYLASGASVGAFVRSAAGVTFHQDLGPVAAVADEVEAFRSAGRRALVSAVAAPEAQLERLVAAANARLDRLGAILLTPLLDRLDGAQRLVVVPHGVLHGVPFQALRADGSALIDRVAVAVSPSLAVRSSREPARTSGPTVLVGRASPELPGVDAELSAIGELLPDAVVLRDSAATIAAVTEAIDGASCVHFATHGIFRSSAPLQSGIRLADGWLSSRHVASLDLRGAVVVLSACDTGRALVDAGDELLGLQRGFLLAGARAVVMSLWPAVDTIAVTTMTRMHSARVSGADMAAALRAGALAARAVNHHPWWWAPFVVSGE